MTFNGIVQFLLFFLAVLALTKPLGVFMAKVFSGEPTFLSKIFGPFERLIYRLCRIEEKSEQSWLTYTAAMLLFSLAGLLLTYAIQRLRYYLPLNPQALPGVAPDLAFNIMLGEVIFGGVGAGLYGILVMVVLTVFIAGLMVGRTPEYLGKKIQAFEVQMAMLTVLVFSLIILTFTGISSVSPGFGTSSILNPGPHGLSEMLYAYSSGAANNGSAFGGLGANTLWYNTTIGLTMLFGRFFMIIPPLAIAGSLSRKKRIPESLGTFPVTTPLFTTLLVGVIVIVGALTFFPALSLGPIVEHFLMQNGQVF
jgi:K+-transporting ATPase A subunit